MQDIADFVGDSLGLSQTDSLAREEKVTLLGFGTFQVTERKGRKGVNPQTGEAIQIPPKKTPKFLPWKRLRKRVRR